MVAPNKIDKWIFTGCKGAKTAEKLRNNIVISKAISRLGPGLKKFLATKKVSTRKEMGVLIGDWPFIHSFQLEPVKTKPSTPGNEASSRKINLPPTTCYNCGKARHRAADCWSKRRLSTPSAFFSPSSERAPRQDV